MKKPSKTQSKKTQSLSRGNRKVGFWSVGLISVIIAALLYWQFVVDDSPNIPQQVPQSKTDLADQLKGRWQRTDGDYVVEIRAVYPDGKVDAAYFNPNPINVGRAEWVNIDGVVNLSVELRDANYPGSTYTLNI